MKTNNIIQIGLALLGVVLSALGLGSLLFGLYGVLLSLWLCLSDPTLASLFDVIIAFVS